MSRSIVSSIASVAVLGLALTWVASALAGPPMPYLKVYPAGLAVCKGKQIQFGAVVVDKFGRAYSPTNIIWKDVAAVPMNMIRIYAAPSATTSASTPSILNIGSARKTPIAAIIMA